MMTEINAKSFGLDVNVCLCHREQKIHCLKEIYTDLVVS